MLNHQHGDAAERMTRHDRDSAAATRMKRIVNRRVLPLVSGSMPPPHPGEGSPVLTRRGDGSGTLCVDRAYGQK